MATKPSDTIESRYPPEEFLSRLEKAFAEKRHLSSALTLLGAPLPQWSRAGDTFRMRYRNMGRFAMHPAFEATGQVERRGHGSRITFAITASKLPLILAGGILLILLGPSLLRGSFSVGTWTSIILAGCLYWMVNLWLSEPWANQLRETILKAAGGPEAN